VNALTITEMTTRGLTRRRGAAALLLALPLAFYLVRHDLPGQSVRFLAIGLAWAASTLALFATLDARAAEPRLVVAGWSRRDLVGGRVAALLGVALAMAATYLGIVTIDRQVDDLAGIALMLGVTACTGVVLGTALGALAARELEGALALFILAGLQFMANPPSTLAHLLPFWSTRELGTYAVDGADAASLDAAMIHAAVTVLLCALVTVTATAHRLTPGPQAPYGE
jgi:hypothetical protein